MGNTSLPKILVADDSASDRELLRELFRGYSCICLEAMNGYLDKPFDIDVMRSMVASLVERNGRQLRLQSDP